MKNYRRARENLRYDLYSGQCGEGGEKLTRGGPPEVRGAGVVGGGGVSAPVAPFGGGDAYTEAEAKRQAREEETEARG